MSQLQEDVLQLIREERARQDAKYGVQNFLPQFWPLILEEEVGEWCEAIQETVLVGANPERGGLEHMKKEALHVAAVAVKFIECLERNRKPWEDFYGRRAQDGKQEASHDDTGAVTEVEGTVQE